MFNFDKKIYRSSLFSDSIDAGFGTRDFDINTISSDRKIVMEQVHSSNIAEVAESSLDYVEGVDGVVTKESNTLLTIKSADCVPILFADVENKIVGASHQGWKGTLLNLASKMVRKMAENGSNIKNVKAAIGPSIGSCCYDLWGPRRDEFMDAYPQYISQIIDENNGKTKLNLVYLNYLQLIDVGIAKDHIDFFPFCTSCDTKRFYSYNRDKGKGRNISCIKLL